MQGVRVHVRACIWHSFPIGLKRILWIFFFLTIRHLSVYLVEVGRTVILRSRGNGLTVWPITTNGSGWSCDLIWANEHQLWDLILEEPAKTLVSKAKKQKADLQTESRNGRLCGLRDRERNGVRGSLSIPLISGYNSCRGFCDMLPYFVIYPICSWHSRFKNLSSRFIWFYMTEAQIKPA